MKGAFFRRAIELEVGQDALDAVLADFYRRHEGAEAASMSDLLTEIETQTGFDTSALTADWRRSLGIPELPERVRGARSAHGKPSAAAPAPGETGHCDGAPLRVHSPHVEDAAEPSATPVRVGWVPGR